MMCLTSDAMQNVCSTVTVKLEFTKLKIFVIFFLIHLFEIDNPSYSAHNTWGNILKRRRGRYNIILESFIQSLHSK